MSTQKNDFNLKVYKRVMHRYAEEIPVQLDVITLQTSDTTLVRPQRKQQTFMLKLTAVSLGMLLLLGITGMYIIPIFIHNTTNQATYYTSELDLFIEDLGTRNLDDLAWYVPSSY